jgi:putative glutamine amidotransferase
MARRYRPLIAVTTQTLQSIDGIPAGLPQSVVMNQRYYVAAAHAGAVPCLVPLFDNDDDTLRELYERVDGILVPGGVDMDPSTYGEAPHPKLGNIDPARDRAEMLMAKWAVEDGKPYLGLCRGAQVLNVAQGGTLWQDLDALYDNAIKHDYFPNSGFERDYLAHDVTIAPKSRLKRDSSIEKFKVNSMHHQGLKKIGSGLAATAFAPDGLVEAVEIEDDDAFIVGVQWHPEVFELHEEPNTKHLFDEFISAASSWHFRDR